MPSLLRALCIAAAVGAATAQLCSSFFSCSTCSSQASCNWCQSPVPYDTSGVCQSSTYSSCTSSSYAMYVQPYVCPSASSCSTFSSCTSCAGSSSPACKWLSPTLPATTTGVCASYTYVYAPSSWYTSNTASACDGYSSTVAAISSGIVAAIVIGVLLLIVLPVALLVAVCCCGVAMCGYKRQQQGSVVVLQQGAQPGMAAYPQAYPQAAGYPQQAFAPGQGAFPQAVPQAIPVSYGSSPVQYTDNRMARSGGTSV